MGLQIKSDFQYCMFLPSQIKVDLKESVFGSHFCTRLFFNDIQGPSVGRQASSARRPIISGKCFRICRGDPVVCCIFRLVLILFMNTQVALDLF